MTVEVRRGEHGDIADVLALAAEYCEADGHVRSEAVARAGLEPLLAGDAHGVVWVAEYGPDDGRDRTLDGYAVVTWGWSIEVGGLDVVLDEIYVRSRGRGSGTQLLQVLEADCRARGVKRIFLETEHPNDSARRLYERHGYEADTSIWMSKELR
jgi:GNAT superfamily N-acetyltransferase